MGLVCRSCTLASCLLTACADDLQAIEDPHPFDGRQFVLEHASGRTFASIEYMRLRFAHQHIEVHTSCNYVSAGYRVERGELILDPWVGISAVACIPSVESHELWIADFLESAPWMSAREPRITLGNDEVTLTFIDVDAYARENLDLVGPLWRLDLVMMISENGRPDGGLIEHPVHDSTPTWPATTLEFRNDGTFATTPGGCPELTGRYRLDDDQLQFDDVISNPEHCPEELTDYGIGAMNIFLQPSARVELGPTALFLYGAGNEAGSWLGFRALRSTTSPLAPDSPPQH